MYPKYAVFGPVSSILVSHPKDDTVELEKVARRVTEMAVVPERKTKYLR